MQRALDALAEEHRLVKHEFKACSGNNAALSAQLAQVHKDAQAEMARLSSHADALKAKLLSER
jgi:hypothetical protein